MTPLSAKGLAYLSMTAGGGVSERASRYTNFVRLSEIKKSVKEALGEEQLQLIFDCEQKDRLGKSKN